MGDARVAALRMIAAGVVALADAIEHAPASGDLVSHVLLARELGLTSKATAALAKRAGGKRSGRVLIVRRSDVDALLRVEPPASRTRRSKLDQELAGLGFG